jgi:hypothetical protein
MIASLVWMVIILFVILTLRQIKQGHEFDDSRRTEALCRAAQRSASILCSQ